MTDVGRKTIGTLLDELTVCNLKLWNIVEVLNHSDDITELAEAGKKAQKLNLRRTLLIQAIDERLGDGDFTVTDKTYGK
jgi:hypothetical protein